MRISLAFFVGIGLSSYLSVAFFLEYLNNRGLAKIKKQIRLIKRKCEVCTAVYFVSSFREFWQCPRCDSINKER